MPKLGYFCPCGKSFATFAALDKHMGRSCYSAFSQTSVPLLDPEEAAASDAAKRVAERSTAAKRQFRDDSGMDARKRATALWLAHFRYPLLVPGTQVDQMKTMHTTMNATACRRCTRAPRRHIVPRRLSDGMRPPSPAWSRAGQSRSSSMRSLTAHHHLLKRYRQASQRLLQLCPRMPTARS